MLLITKSIFKLGKECDFETRLALGETSSKHHLHRILNGDGHVVQVD